MAKYTTEANRINQYTPYGELTYSNNPTTTFDQAGYDQAMEQYNNDLSAYEQANAAPVAGLDLGNNSVHNGNGLDFSSFQAPAATTAPTAPDKNAFNSTKDNWS
ncbi:MAG: hypothetical protein NUV74_12780, partial [Candidatus Brocadiaceae bacterium]|nr:hypothetical protein [Candidatus Brocadiaceae bacterium]